MAKLSENRERFLRLAGARVQKILDQIHTLGNCANKAQYEYNDSDIEEISEALEKATNALLQKFTTGKSESFKFGKEV